MRATAASKKLNSIIMVIIIAHCLRTGAGADKIIVINKGQAVEQGTYEELIRKKGLYKRLYSIQQKYSGCISLK